MDSATIRKLDREYGLMLRRKVTVCRMCLQPLDDTAQVSHCYGRASMAVRWDERNAWLVHDSCHRKWEKMPKRQRKTMLELVLGINGAAKLERLAVSAKKWTDAEAKEMLRRFKE
jgi:5-methylcytosine-specific restriction endonuclease McrA